MGAPDDLLYEYAVIRFVPRVDREEFINIGLIMMSKRHKWLKAMVMFDDDRIKALYPDSDIECLKNQARIFEMEDVPSPDLPVEERYRWLSAVKSACLQLSPSHPALLPTISNPPIPNTHIPNTSIPNTHIPNTHISNPPIPLLEAEFSRLFHLLIL